MGLTLIGRVDLVSVGMTGTGSTSLRYLLYMDFVMGYSNTYCVVLFRSFIEIAHKLGLYVILQPGPYVGAQLDFGGLPR